MTLQASIELLQEALRIHTNTIEQIGATGYARDLRQAWKVIEDKLKESSGESQQDLQTPSAEETASTLEPFCVVVGKTQCEELLKTVELYTNWKWSAGDYPTQWSPFSSMHLRTKHTIIFYPESSTITFSLKISNDKPEIPFDKALQIIQNI